MTQNQTLAIVLATLLVTSLVAGVGAVSAGDTTTLDETTGLTHDSTIEDYEETGVATTTETVPDMTLTVADRADDVGISGIQHTDFDTTYLRLEYNEDIERTIRFYVPREYWYPHPDELEAVDSDLTASMEPVEGSEYAAIEVHVEDETDAVFEVKEQASIVFNVRDYGAEWLENETGIDIPMPDGESEQWEYIPTAELTDEDPTVGIDTDGEDLTIQYDAANTPDPTEKTWRSVPECSSSGGADAPVCTFTQSEHPDRVYVLAQTEDPPDVRFKYGSDWWAELQSSIGDLLEIPGEVLEDVRAIMEDVR